MKNKIDSLQFIRAFAAILVANSHIWNDGILWGIINDFGGYGVDLFFVLSGFVMALTVKLNLNTNAQNAGNFLNRRITRIFPIYIVCVIPLLIYFTYKDGVQTLFFYLGNLLLLPSFDFDMTYRLVLGPGWTLIYEMFFYYVFSFILLFSNNKNKVLYAVLTVLFAMVLYVQFFHPEAEELWAISMLRMMGNPLLWNFACGILVYYIYERNKGKVDISLTKGLIYFAVLSCIAIVLLFFKFPRFVALGIPSFLIISIFVFINNRHFDNPWGRKLVFIGDASYSIYITHYYFELFRPQFYEWTGSMIYNQAVTRNLTAIFLVILAVVFGCIFYVLVEKPLIKIFAPKKVGTLEKRTP